MSNKRIYALLVGINDYPSPVGKLQGCINDVESVKTWLSDSFSSQLNLEILKDSDATRENIIQLFRSHLGKAGRDDTVLFHYSGHGARSQSSGAFKQFYPDGKDEGLVCYDSRTSGGFDLADKELAVLLSEIARNEPHIAVLLDCCHSGSGTRGADDITQAHARFTEGTSKERLLDTYLNGYYSARMAKGESLEIPSSSHILLAACERVQKAWESKDHHGVFTRSLLEVLDQSGTNVSYADMFMRIRATVRRYADNQTPQFETCNHFNAYSGFLGNIVPDAGRYYSVSFDTGSWKVNCGALHGLPSDPDKVVELALYAESERSVLVGHAETTQVSAQESELILLDINTDDLAVRYKAQLTSMPTTPLIVQLEGDKSNIDFVQKRLSELNDQSLGFEFSSSIDSNAQYILTVENVGNGKFLLRERRTGRLIQIAQGDKSAAIDHIFLILNRIATWERTVTLQNQGTRMDKDAVTFQFGEKLENGEYYIYLDNKKISSDIDDKKISSDVDDKKISSDVDDKKIPSDVDDKKIPSDEIAINITKKDDVWQEITAKLQANNRTNQPLHYALVYFSDDFGIQVPYNERIETTDDFFDLMIADSGTFELKLEDQEGDEAIHIFKLIVSTERIDDFLLNQEAIKIGKTVSFPMTRGSVEKIDRGAKGISFGKPRKKLVYQNEWFTKTIRVKLVRQLASISSQDINLANGGIIVKAHPSLKADISLGSIQMANRSVGGSDFYRVLERQGMELLNFSGTRGEMESVLELTNIQNPEAIKDNPLEIELDLKLNEDEYILPISFDGEDILLVGEPEKNVDGRTLIHIDHIPDDIPDQRKSLGKALKLYFFKTYLKRTEINQLCWVEYMDDGSVIRHPQGVSNKVAAATNILLLIHGIIGDTEGMAKGLRLATDTDGKSIDAKFDLVLTYDYENLNTNIQDTACQLSQQLRDLGLHAQDNKRLTLLVHSMGGLVARWFIEREGGNQFVDHLVMCGTPNVGSPFGKIDSARDLTCMLTNWAINSSPAFAPFGAGLLVMLGRSRKITACLEQMNPSSEFIQALNESNDPMLRYSILAGDIRDYKEQSNELMAKLTSKIGKGHLFNVLYQNAGHDIAVSLASIQGVPDTRQPSPLKQEVACHHLNYFVSEAGLKALVAVKW